MKLKPILLAAALVTLTFSLSFSGYAVDADQTPSLSMEQQILVAKSKADHEALASQYENEAKELQAKAVQHKRMTKAYAEYVWTERHDLGLHCNRLAQKYEDAAKENFALAKLHHGLAEKAD